MQHCLLFAFIALAWVGANEHAITDDLETSNAADQKPATHDAVGRFAFARYGESLVLLDTATGRTWILEREGNSEKPCWSTLGDCSGRTVAGARKAPNGRVDLQTVPEQSVIILRGAKEDVTGAQEAIRAIASEPSSVAERTGLNVTVVALNSLDPADTAAILTEVYKETPDVIVEALPKMKCTRSELTRIRPRESENSFAVWRHISQTVTNARSRFCP